MFHTLSNFFPGKQEVKPRAECPEYLDEKSRSIEYYFSDEELNKPVKRLWIGSGEDGHLYNEVSCDN